MDAEQKTRRGLLAAIALVPIVLVAALWLPRWWEGRELRQAREIAGVGSRLQDGSMTDARQKIDPGKTAEQVEAAIGKASFAVGTEGRESKHEIWTYYYKDGTMTVNLTDGTVARVSTIYGTPRIPKKGGGY
jgi:flagellar basal body-associated protein FliL